MLQPGHRSDYIYGTGDKLERQLVHSVRGKERNPVSYNHLAVELQVFAKSPFCSSTEEFLPLVKVHEPVQI